MSDPRYLTRDEFVARLLKAGWELKEAQDEWARALVEAAEEDGLDDDGGYPDESWYGETYHDYEGNG